MPTVGRSAARRRPVCGILFCAAVAYLLLLLSAAVLYARLGNFNFSIGHGGLVIRAPISFDSLHHGNNPLLHSPSHNTTQEEILINALLADDDGDMEEELINADSEDPIDEFDKTGENSGEQDVNETEYDKEERNPGTSAELKTRKSGFFWDHISGVKRRAFDKQVTDADNFGFRSDPGLADRRKLIFTSDDEPLDEKIRAQLDDVRGVEDALLLKSPHGDSTLRDGWASWFDQKGVFLRRDRMFRSNFESLNPLHNPLLQDPDMPGITSLNRREKISQKAMWKDIFTTPFGGSLLQRMPSTDNPGKATARKLNAELNSNVEHKRSSYADRRQWGYYPGLASHLPFSVFMTQFFRMAKCSTRFFMAWNIPPWMFGVRHQRGLESVLYHHRDACVVVFSETIDLDFFRDFVKEGFKVTVVMPNLDELLKHTPAHSFASFWHKWRNLPSYPIHYSELVRLAALYKYGGLYLDFDVIVLRQLHALHNTIGVEDELNVNASFSGAVMAFKKRSPFIMECLREFSSMYDGTCLHNNGAELLTRVIKRLRTLFSPLLVDLRVKPTFAFYPIHPANISRYFVSPADEADRIRADALFKKIMDESFTLHFYNTLTSSLVPEPDSLVHRLMTTCCLRCLDVL